MPSSGGQDTLFRAHKLVEQLEPYCVYLDSDRDYIIGQALEIAFKKDKGFMEQWRSKSRSTGK